MELIVETESAMEALGGKLAAGCGNGGVVYLCGELGAGKTTLSRGLLHGLGHQGSVKSPTYTLVEPYELRELRIYHIDLYRLNDTAELEYTGLRDYFLPGQLCLVEWPERAVGVLPQADVQIDISYATDGRNVRLQALTLLGKQIVANL